jgi:hypothetical protein
MEQLQKDQEFLQAAQATLEAETQEMVKVSNRLHDNLVKAMRLMWRQLLFIWGVVIILFIAYFVLNRPSPVTRAAAPEAPTLAKPEPAANLMASPVPPAQQSPAIAAPSEWEEITGVLEQIREAQLKKDINLFLGAYSPGFPDIDKKKENILKTWQQYNYVDMQFHIEDLQKPGAHTVVAKIAWNITLEDVRSKKKSTMAKDYTIHFSDASGKWLIQELIQEEKTSAVAARRT